MVAGSAGFSAEIMRWLGARDFDPVLQRFTTVDPVQVLDVPLQWNPYLYGDNSPVTKADPSRTYESHPWTDSRFVVEYVCGRNTVDAGSGWDFTRTVWIHVPAGS